MPIRLFLEQMEKMMEMAKNMQGNAAATGSGSASAAADAKAMPNMANLANDPAVSLCLGLACDSFCCVIV